MFFLHKYLKKFVNLILFKVSNKFLYNYKIFDEFYLLIIQSKNADIKEAKKKCR